MKIIATKQVRNKQFKILIYLKIHSSQILKVLLVVNITTVKVLFKGEVTQSGNAFEVKSGTVR